MIQKTKYLLTYSSTKGHNFETEMESAKIGNKLMAEAEKVAVEEIKMHDEDDNLVQVHVQYLPGSGDEARR